MKEIQSDIEAYKKHSISSGEDIDPLRSPIDDQQIFDTEVNTAGVINDVPSENYSEVKNDISTDVFTKGIVIDENDDDKSDTNTWPDGSDTSDDTESDTPGLLRTLS